MKTKIVSAAASIVVLVTTLLSCSSNPPTVPSAPKDYVVYFERTSPVQSYFGYHTVSGRIDSLHIPYLATAGPIECSPDGHLLYIPSGNSVIAVNTETQQVEDEIPYTALHGLTPSPDGRYLALHGNSLRLVRLSDYAIVYEDTISTTSYTIFSQDGQRLYYVRWNYSTSVFCIDLERGFAFSEVSLPIGSVVTIIPSHDDSELFLYCAGRTVNCFAVYDRDLDSVLFLRLLDAGSGDMVITPDQRYIFLTEAGDVFENEGRWYLTVFDVDASRVERLIPTAGLLDGFEPAGLFLDHLVVTPDGRWLIVGGGSVPNVFLRLNIEEMQFDRYVQMPESNRLISFTGPTLPSGGYTTHSFGGR